MNNFNNFLHYTNRLLMDDILGDVFVEFSSVNTAEEKFTVTRVTLEKYGMLAPELPSRNCRLSHNHSCAVDWRMKGNECLKTKEYLAAIRNYTESLLCAEPGSECYALALANRSAALFHHNKYESCLKDIRRAFESKYPVRLMYKLYERAGSTERKLGHGDLAEKYYLECLKYIQKSSMIEAEKNEFIARVLDAIGKCKGLVEQKTYEERPPVDELLGGRNESIPALSIFLELKCSQNMGRGVYATCDINPGDVVVIDEPYISEPSPGILFLCSYINCLKFSLATIPCPKCSLVVYCDEECMKKASEDGHYLECPIMLSIRSLPGVPKENEFVVKWFLRDCSKMGLDKFCSVISDLSIAKVDTEARGFNENGEYKSDNLLTAYSVEDIENKNLSMDGLFFFNCIAVEMLHYLKLSGFRIPEKHIATVGASLVHMLNIVDLNFWKSNLDAPSLVISSNHYRYSTVSFVLALYPTICLFNHSCDPNVKWSGVLSDRRRVMKAVQPIPKGSQLFVSYGLTFTTSSKSLRTKFLMDRYKFKCCCQPCLENWSVSRYIPNRLSTLNLLNFSMADTVVLECKKFIDFKKTMDDSGDVHPHLNYLYSFMKLLFDNVKRPFALYEECLSMISSAHINHQEPECGYFCMNL